MSDAHEAARKIMALVDEHPSEPFSYERRIIEEKLYVLICKHTQQTDDELDTSFALGFDEGYEQAYAALKEEYSDRIEELEQENLDLAEDIQTKLDDAFTEGYEAARIEYGLN